MIGEVMYVKITGEPNYVIGERGDYYLVRRPIMSSTKGIQYELAYVLKEELESREGKTKREVMEMRADREAIMQDQIPQAQAADEQLIN